MTKTKLQIILKQLTDKIVKDYQPEKIILFGSAVSGEMGIDSDLDIAIVKNTNKRFYDRIGEVLRTIRNINNKPPIDFIVYTPSEFEDMKRKSYFVKDEILNKGKVIYEQ
ncbi:nucleotidyltransferase domain-containing protein [Candidatus Roizmanbacteria bacterium]|nr:nucleotidyltransferase domain-containing protein [Candidatus Roizmanbacteria bacterium]